MGKVYDVDGGLLTLRPVTEFGRQTPGNGVWGWVKLPPSILTLL